MPVPLIKLRKKEIPILFNYDNDPAKNSFLSTALGSALRHFQDKVHYDPVQSGMLAIQTSLMFTRTSL